MKKRTRWVLLILGILLVAMALGFWWFWSLGSLALPSAPKLQLVIEKGEVSITPQDKQIAEKATSGMELHPGDRLKTGENSVASIMAYGQADVRLDQNTELVIKQASDQGDYALDMRWQLLGGRVWSRVLRLLDLDSAFEGQANQVIATVRGTSFGLSADDRKTGVMVDHAGVKIDGIVSPATRYLVGGQWTIVDQQGTIQAKGDTSSSTWRDDPWISANQDEDKRYVAAAMAGLMDATGYRQGTPPDAWDYGIAQWSEGLHLLFAGKKAPELRSRYLGRSLGQVYDLIQRGKSGLASQQLTDVENDTSKFLSGQDAAAYRAALRPIIGHVLLGLTESDPDSSLYRFKVRVEDLYAQVWSDDPAQTFYARALSVDARLDEAERFDCQTQDQVMVTEAINAVEQGLMRQKNDWSQLQAGLDDARKSVLTEKMEVQGLRLAFLKQRLAACSAPPSVVPGSSTSTVSATSTPMATSTPAINLKPPSGSQTSATMTRGSANPTSQTTTQPPTTGQASQNPTNLGLVRIELFAQPNPANVGDTVRFYVKGYKADGSTLDVTNQATFQTTGGLGSLSETAFVPAKAGSTTIQATIADGGRSLNASTVLTVNQSVTLSSLSIAPNGGKLSYGQSTALSVTAHYSNGYAQDVTSSATWSLSNTLARLAGTTLTAGQQPGSVTVTASYSENGTTQTASATFQVMSATVANPLQ